MVAGTNDVQREQKIELAHQYGHTLVEAHPAIRGLILGGSVARGNDLPVSDIDIWCFADETGESLPIEKHYAAGIYVDIEKQPTAVLRDRTFLQDPYICGYLYDAIILFDRDGEVRACQRRAREHMASPAVRQEQLRPVRAGIERNYGEFHRSIQANDASETCRASIFAAWSLCDHALIDRGVPPGGARGLVRLAVVWPGACQALTDLEGAAQLDGDQAAHLIAVYEQVADRSSFFGIWLDKVKWMFANGCTAAAFHALWIALGLRIKDARGNADARLHSELDAASRQWLTIIGWEGPVLRGKLNLLRATIDAYCGPFLPGPDTTITNQR
jgi:predicted nucleotidyltransferase